MEYALVGVGALTAALIFILSRMRRQGDAESQPQEAEGGDKEKEASHVPPVTCCGAHEVCEAETLLALSDKVIYYDDEELDRFRGTRPDDYDDDAIDEFREVLLTLQTHEVAGWLRSLNLRHVDPPTEIRDEALMIVSEFRSERRASANGHDKKTETDG